MRPGPSAGGVTTCRPTPTSARVGLSAGSYSISLIDKYVMFTGRSRNGPQNNSTTGRRFGGLVYSDPLPGTSSSPPVAGTGYINSSSADRAGRMPLLIAIGSDAAS